MINKQITYISFGNKSNTELNKSIDSLYKLNLDYKIQVITNNYVHRYTVPKVNSIIVNLIHPDNNVINSRYYKTRLNKYATDLNIYLDSDTEVISKDIDHIFNILDDGYDLVLSYSSNQDNDVFWHISENERNYTIDTLGYIPLQYQCGVIGYCRNDITDRFFNYWYNEWDRYKGQDQAAFVRAINELPELKIYLLGKPFNDSRGIVIKHNFGKIRG